MGRCRPGGWDGGCSADKCADACADASAWQRLSVDMLQCAGRLCPAGQLWARLYVWVARLGDRA